MAVIELLYAQNSITRAPGALQQTLAFWVLVENLAYDKQVTVHWAGEDGRFHALPAWFVYNGGENREVWCARATRVSGEESPLPGNVRFRLACAVDGRTHTDDAGDGREHTLQADAGIRLGHGVRILHTDHVPALANDQRALPVTVAVADGRGQAQPRRVFVRWTTDDWQTYQDTPCRRRANYWDGALQSAARNPNQYGVAVWTARLKLGDAYRVQYVVGCETAAGLLWDNNFGRDYAAARARLGVLTLNLHCYQEEEQDAKLTRIAQAINDLDVDFVCLQEVAENWNNGHGDWDSNAARIIHARLQRNYHLFTDWSHRGFDRYREGVAILSRHPLLKKEARYVSASQDAHSIHARKVVMIQVRVPYVGLINVFSAHLSWWEDGFAQQFAALRDWASQAHTRHVAATLLCGDFNVQAGSRGFREVVRARDFEDQFLKVQARPVFDQVFRQPTPQWPSYFEHDGRIDYIFLRRDSRLRAVAARLLFTPVDYGLVSDHPGYYAAFEPK